MSKKLLILTLFIVLLPSIAAYDLSNFPEPYVFEGRYNSLIVIGEVAKAEDVIAASDTLKILSKFENATKPCQGWVECERRIGSSPMKLATEIDSRESLKEENIISVGGPCANKITAQIMDLPKTWPECANGFEEGFGKIILYNKWNKTQLIIAGYGDEDTRKAAKVLVSYNDYNLSGEQVEIVGNISNPTIGKILKYRYNTPLLNKLDVINFAKEWIEKHTFERSGCTPCTSITDISNFSVNKYVVHYWDVYLNCGGCNIVLFPDLSVVEFHCAAIPECGSGGWGPCPNPCIKYSKNYHTN